MSAQQGHPPTVAVALAAAGSRLAEAGVGQPRVEAERLLAELLETDRGGLVARRGEPLDPALAARFAGWVGRRSGREPLQQITGSQEFYGLAFKTDRRALIPRPETEGLVDALLDLELPAGAVVADLGTGSGCIAVTLAKRRPGLELCAVDCSEDALALARENARAHGVERRIGFVHGRFEEPPPGWRGRFDAVVSNPPYVSESEWAGLEPEVRDHEPRAALVPGPSGYESYTALLPSARFLLKEDGCLLVELGWGQADRVREIAERAGLVVVEIRPDLRRIPRVLVARRRGRADAGTERA